TGTPHEVAEQTGVFTRAGIERIVRYGFEVAAKRPRRMLASATKSNALQHSMVLWDEVAEAMRPSYPSVQFRKYHVDALAVRLSASSLRGNRERRILAGPRGHRSSRTRSSAKLDRGSR